MGHHHDRRGPRRDRRDFWKAWREEQGRMWHEQSPPGTPGAPPWAEGFPQRPPRPPHEMENAWREFFHSFMGDWPEGHWIFGGRRFSPWHSGQVSFNPFVANLLSKGGGLLPLYMLHLVSQKPRYGNEIMEILAERTGGQWVSNPGAIYPLLNELEQQGLIEGIWEDPRKRTMRIYSLTQAGEQELSRLKAIVDPKLKEAVDMLQNLMNDLNSSDNASDEADDETTPRTTI